MECLVALKNRLVDGKLEVQKEIGYVGTEEFIFNKGATDSEIKKLPCFATEDLIEFLKMQNGAKLFSDPIYRDEFTFFSVDEIIEYSQIWECPVGFLAIGTGPDGEWIIYEMNREEGKRIWYAEFTDCEDESDALPFDFPTWLDYLIVAQGEIFWEWFN
ncbi:SMI1/KNR4 family protein [Exiguobacterium artemiae]|uniref:SMI1/KNR4 family protein n=1 Tax=Exiguobacterium artemiae TaxID=340145 RepID=UPI003D06D2A9